MEDPTTPTPPLRWGLENLVKKTPVFAVRVGRGLVALALYAGGNQFAKGHERLGVYIFAAGALGWFLTAMFTDEAVTPPALPTPFHKTTPTSPGA